MMKLFVCFTRRNTHLPFIKRITRALGDMSDMAISTILCVKIEVRYIHIFTLTLNIDTNTDGRLIYHIWMRMKGKLIGGCLCNS